MLKKKRKNEIFWNIYQFSFTLFQVLEVFDSRNPTLRYHFQVTVTMYANLAAFTQSITLLSFGKF